MALPTSGWPSGGSCPATGGCCPRTSPRTCPTKAPVAQRIERLPSKQRVAGSSPAGGAAKPQVRGYFARSRLTASNPELPPNHAGSRGSRVVVWAYLDPPARPRPTGRDARTRSDAAGTETPGDRHRDRRWGRTLALPTGYPTDVADAPMRIDAEELDAMSQDERAGWCASPSSPPRRAPGKLSPPPRVAHVVGRWLRMGSAVERLPMPTGGPYPPSTWCANSAKTAWWPQLPRDVLISVSLHLP